MSTDSDNEGLMQRRQPHRPHQQKKRKITLNTNNARFKAFANAQKKSNQEQQNQNKVQSQGKAQSSKENINTINMQKDNKATTNTRNSCEIEQYYEAIINGQPHGQIKARGRS